MEHIGTFVIYIIMMCAIAGAVASIFNNETGLGKNSWQACIVSVLFLFQ